MIELQLICVAYLVHALERKSMPNMFSLDVRCVFSHFLVLGYIKPWIKWNLFLQSSSVFSSWKHFERDAYAWLLVMRRGEENWEILRLLCRDSFDAVRSAKHWITEWANVWSVKFSSFIVDVLRQKSKFLSHLCFVLFQVLMWKVFFSG